MRRSEEELPATVTLRDVARLANVHPSTVSRVLNGARRSRVTVDTAQRIQAIAEELGYRPNMIARGLRTRRSRSVGVLVTDLGNPVIPPIVGGIEQRLGEEGYTVLLGNTDHSSSRERLHLEAMRAKLVDGVISATATLEPASSTERWLALAMPVVLVNRGSDDARVAAAVPDDRRCAELAVEHLVSLGHTRIAHVAGSAATTTGRRRREGFEGALARSGLRADPALVVASERYTIAEGARCCAMLIERAAGRFSAIVAANDLLALGCCDALRGADLPCPDAISVVGCNDMPFADRFEPALTTVHVPHAQLGRAAADLLLERLEDPGLAPREVSIRPHLVVRASSGPAPAP
jgi:LacI family transcriptional regulator, galactose operon repressor